MYLELNKINKMINYNNLIKSNFLSSASISNLYKRANIIEKIRKFFKKNNFLEVETPILSQATITDINIIPFKVIFNKRLNKNKIVPYLYLTTSPEFHMKRLLASGISSIFQICHSFRNEEYGRYHNPEFTILEWYHINYNMHDIMHETNNLLKHILKCKNARYISYRKIFIKYLNIDPFLITKKKLFKKMSKYKLNNFNHSKYCKDTILQLLFSIKIKPYIGHSRPLFIYHFPSSQASLAKINKNNNKIADRFEVYIRGMEIANGFYELDNFKEQETRFIQDNIKRKELGLEVNKIDKRFLLALRHGMPKCSGVALGVDRLIMIAINAYDINQVIPFTFNDA